MIFIKMVYERTTSAYSRIELLALRGCVINVLKLNLSQPRFSLSPEIYSKLPATPVVSSQYMHPNKHDQSTVITFLQFPL